MKKTKLVIFLFALVNIIQIFQLHKWNQNITLKYDGSGYYVYLPASIIYKDLAEMKFYATIDSIYHPSNEYNYYSLYKNPENNRYTNKYPIGVAIGELPLFLIAHWHTLHFNKVDPADGYSPPYRLSVILSSFLWSIIGLFVLSIFLKKFFNDSTTALNLLIIGFGTNLYCYTFLESGLSHGLEFMLFALVLFFTERLYQMPNSKYAILLGLVLGWVLIARPIDFLVVFIPLFWPIKDKTNNNRIGFFLKHKTQLLYCAFASIFIASLQLAYWKYTTGHFIHFSYEEEGFNFSNPEIFNGLFSFRKGWFVYTPIALISFLGLFVFTKQLKGFAFPILTFFILFIYFVFSWQMWWYGWGFGARPMIETYAILSIPLAALIAWIGSQKLVIKAFSVLVFGFFIWLNIYQTEQYRMGAIHGDKMSQKFYWHVWNKMHPKAEDWQYLAK